MSLVICANESEGTVYDKMSMNNAPFSFVNSLKQTMIIPPHSAVALQSIKINKDGLLSISPHDTWYMYMGRNLVSSETVSSELTPYSPIRAVPELTDPTLSEDVNMNEWCDKIAKGFNRAVPHPDVFGQLTFTPHRTGGLGFLGYSIVTDYVNTQAATDNRTDDWVSAYLLDDGLTYDHAAKTLTGFSGTPVSTATGGAVDENTSIMTKYPLSHQNGILDWDVSGLQVGGLVTGFTTHWQIGLNRAVTGGTSAFNCNTYFSAHESTGFENPGFNENQFDYVISCDQTGPGSDRYLKVHHMVKGGLTQNTCMQEIDYFSFVGNTWSDARYNMSTNSEDYDGVRITIANEIVGIHIGVVGGAYKTITSFDMASATCLKGNYPKPAGQTCWNLYPKVTICGGPTKSCEFLQYAGRVNVYDGGSYYESQTSDWNNRMSAQGLEGSVMKEKDIGYWADMLDATEYDQVGGTVGGGKNTLTDTEIQVIVGPAEKWFNNTNDANMSNKWGFQSRPVLSVSSGATAHGDRGYKYISDQVPEITSTSSLFVRLDDFTQKSINAGVGRPSKIIYHLPRFDNSNREVGTGLYYEPGQRTYLCLDNSEAIHVNDFRISICNEKERLARDLTGKTIICLHIIKDRDREKNIKPDDDEIKLIS